MLRNFIKYLLLANDVRTPRFVVTRGQRRHRLLGGRFVLVFFVVIYGHIEVDKVRVGVVVFGGLQLVFVLGEADVIGGKGFPALAVLVVVLLMLLLTVNEKKLINVEAFTVNI